MGSTGKAVVLQAAPLELCTKSQVCQTEILRCAGIYPCNCTVRLGHGDCCLRTFLQLFSAAILCATLRDSSTGFPKSCPCPSALGMGLRGETGDGSTSLASIPSPQPSGTSWWVPQPHPATCQQRELALCRSAKIVEIISCSLIPGSEWLRAQTSAWGVEAASGINGQHRKLLDLNHVTFLTIRKQDKKPRQTALSRAKPSGVALRMQHWVPKIILFPPQL